MSDNMINYLTEIRNHFAAYHNHKEIKAWGGLILYVLSANFISRIELVDDCVFLICLTAIILVITIAAYCYINHQLKLKDNGGSYVATAFWFINKVVTEEITEAQLKSRFKITESERETKIQAEVYLPADFLNKAAELDCQGMYSRYKPNVIIFTLLAIFSVISILVVWS